jgi:hypothetical protein
MAKKIYINEDQYNKFIYSDNKKHYKKEDLAMDCIKANRKARREEERDIYGDGFKQKTKIAKSNKTYSRKGKNKFKNDFYDE